ncbi:centromere protein O [Bombina bombina]|uniref:centromere protein O n=1 Tax=Bombina bombina TaxID=8345 RepID=UPI00235AFFEA|nr:centromere protein O [Bombina bombina]
MEEVQTRFREGVLSHLEQLESLSHNLSVKQEQKRQEHEALDKMRETILKLRLQRDELKAKVSQQKQQLLALKVEEEVIPDPEDVAEGAQKAALEMRLAEVKGILEAYWLTGISGKMTKKGVCICISTAYEGTYLDTYNLDLVMQPTPRIVHHSVPPFIPLEKLAKTHLEKDLKQFLIVLFEHLNAYAGRKYQADQLQIFPGPFICGTLQRNSLCTLLSFEYNLKLEGRIYNFSAKLQYCDITRCLPTKAVVTCNENVPPIQDKLSSHSILFQQKPLHKALEIVRSEEETLNGTHSSLVE